MEYRIADSINKGFWYDVLWAVKGDALSGRNKVAVVKIAIGCNVKVTTAEDRKISTTRGYVR